MKSKDLIITALSAAFVAAAGVSTPAFALEPKQCLPMAEMNAALKAEGQRTMIMGDRQTPVADKTMPAGIRIVSFVNTVTSNADSSLGYQLEGNLPKAQASTEVCVAAKLTNIQFFDARKPGTPAAAKLGGPFNSELERNERLGTRPMVQADTLHRQADGSVRLGLKITLLQNPAHLSGFLLANYPDGRTDQLAQMHDTDYTPAGRLRVGDVIQVASLSPN